jgi:Tol biopolymer transport system component
VDPARPERQIRLSRADGDPIAWSSDGTKLLIRRKSPNQVPGGVRETDLFVFDADGTETRLTNAQTFVTGGSFSPDGSEVVYATTFSPKGSAIYAVNSDGGAPRLILRATRRVSIEGRSFLTDVYHPALSPDGTQIGYFDGMGDHSHNLWVMNADGTERSLLLDEGLAGPGHMNALTWSPVGEWLAFQTDDHIYLVRPDGSGLRPVVEGLGRFITAPAVQWSPDGSRIAYLREGALSIANVDGGNERIVEGIRASCIAWNPAV